MLMLVAMVMVLGSSAVRAQQMPPIPVDDQVRIGQLPNGLTYYIRHNENPKGQADFYIAQKVGSILEEENQRGLLTSLNTCVSTEQPISPATNSATGWNQSV